MRQLYHILRQII